MTATGKTVSLDGGEDNDNLYAYGYIDKEGSRSYLEDGTATLIGGNGNDNIRAEYYENNTVQAGDGDDNI